jgi:tetratricopeptide (TPR) repeat protein
MNSATREPLQVFISYAHEDESLCQEFLTHLSQLQRDGMIRDWHDRRISGGSEWAGQIDEHLNTADIVVLLVSPDFLASEYCYDVEMKRALERHAAGTARVVPVILRPADWKTSPFSVFNALPTDGKPVVDWKTHDHAFLNVVEGLRQVIRELREPALIEPVIAALPRIRKLRPWHLALAGGLIVALIAAGWFWRTTRHRHQQAQQYATQGDRLLDVGRYEQAREPYQQALKLNAGNRAASLGLRIADLDKVRPDAVLFEQRLSQLLKEAPNDPHLKVLEGGYLVSHSRWKEALARYQQAIRLNPNLAEAYFRMGVLYDYQGNLTRATEMYEQAVKLAPDSPQYASNLADQYFKHGEYQEAITAYRNTRKFTLAELELAKIFRLRGQLTDARHEGSLAIEWLGEPAVANTPENLLPWWLDSEGGQYLSLTSQNDKLCYARMELSATYYLGGDAVRAKNHADRAADCGAVLHDIRAVIAWELQRVAQEQTNLSRKAAEYRRKFLQ